MRMRRLPRPVGVDDPHRYSSRAPGSPLFKSAPKSIDQQPGVRLAQAFPVPTGASKPGVRSPAHMGSCACAHVAAMSMHMAMVRGQRSVRCEK